MKGSAFNFKLKAFAESHQERLCKCRSVGGGHDKGGAHEGVFARRGKVVRVTMDLGDIHTCTS